MKSCRVLILILFNLSACVNDTAQVSLTCIPSHPVSWSADVKALIETKCATPECHPAHGSYQVPLGTYEQVHANQYDIRAQVSDRKMPRGGQLSEREIFLITCWIDQGALQN